MCKAAIDFESFEASSSCEVIFQWVTLVPPSWGEGGDGEVSGHSVCVCVYLCICVHTHACRIVPVMPNCLSQSREVWHGGYTMNVCPKSE